MSADSANRSTARAAIAASLSTYLVTTHGVANVVYGSRWRLEGKVAVMIADKSSNRIDATLDADVVTSEFRFDIFTFVPFGENDASWTETNAEDARANIEKHVTDWCIDNINTANWHALQIDGETTCTTLVGDDGTAYKHEQIPIKVTWFNR